MDKSLQTASLPGRILHTSKTDYLYFSGTSYLGMACNSQFLEYLQEGIKQYGTNYSSSRLSNVQLAVFAEAENFLADYIGAEAALTVSSGFLAGQLVVRTLAERGSFFYGPRTHPALWLTSENFHNRNFTDWCIHLSQQIQNCPDENIFLLFNSLDPLWAQQYPLNWVKSLPQTKNITLIIDDSHGLGVTGNEGAGIYASVKSLTDLTVILVSSLGKALGIPGGVIAGSTTTIQQFKSSGFFGGGSPVIPAYLYAFLKSHSLYEEARRQLFSSIEYFIFSLNKPEIFQYFDQYPVFYTAQNELYTYLLKQNILISSFPYPTPQENQITRIVLNSLHTKEDIDTLTFHINNFTQNYSQ